MLRLVLGGLLASLARGWTPQDTNAAVKSVDGALRNAPCVVLVRPRLDENVGAVARAMANFGLADLRLVAPAPTCDWCSEAAARRACGAHAILERATAHARLGDALGDCHRAYATSARLRRLNARVVASPDAARDMARAARSSSGGRAALLFGAEDSGLTNDELELADFLVQVPAADAFSSLNLAMAVTIVGSDVFRAWAPRGDGEDGEDGEDGGGAAAASAAAADDDPAVLLIPEPGDAVLRLHNDEPSTKAQQITLADRYADALAAAGFTDERKHRRLRRFLTRAAPTFSEVGTLHGVLTALTRGVDRRAPAAEEEEAAP